MRAGGSYIVLTVIADILHRAQKSVSQDEQNTLGTPATCPCEGRTHLAPGAIGVSGGYVSSMRGNGEESEPRVRRDEQTFDPHLRQCPLPYAVRLHVHPESQVLILYGHNDRTPGNKSALRQHRAMLPCSLPCH